MITTWTTRDGTEVPIAGMSHRHLANTIGMLNRDVDDIVESFDRLIVNGKLTGPVDCLNLMLSGWRFEDEKRLAMTVETKLEKLAALEAEAERRGLEVHA